MSWKCRAKERVTDYPMLRVCGAPADRFIRYEVEGKPAVRPVCGVCLKRLRKQAKIFRHVPEVQFVELSKKEFLVSRVLLA